MDFVAVPAGTAPVAALALRGADPTLSFATADSFNTTLGNTLCAIAGAPGRMEAAYSNVAAELVGALFTSDPAVLDAPVILHAIDPTKLRAVWLRLLADGQDDAVSLTGRRFRYERDAILAGLDYANLAAGYLVTAADLFLTEAVGTGRAAAALIGGAGTSWIRSGTIGSFATPVRGHPNLYSLAPLADLYRYALGIFCTASRDQPGNTFRLVIEECQRRAQDARVPYASVASASPLLTARAAAKAFVATAPAGPNWELHGPNGTLGDLGRRAQDWADRCSLAGSITAGGGHAFLEVVCRRFDELEFALPSLHRILEGLLSVQAITNELAALATGCFKPARGLPESVQDLLAIEGACLELVSPMEEQNLISAGQRVAWVCGMLQSAHARGGGGGGGGALAGSSEPSDPGTMQRVRAALSSGASRVFFTELRALLDAAPPNSLTISRKLTSSPIAFIKRMGMGIAPPAAYTSSLWRDEFDRASIHVLKDKWRYNLSMRLAADKYGKVRQTAEKWRIDERTAAAIAEYRFDEVDWFGLIYEVRGIQGDTDFVLAPAEIHFSEIDHFTSLEMVVKRIEDALSLDAPATNSLSSASRTTATPRSRVRTTSRRSRRSSRRCGPRCARSGSRSSPGARLCRRFRTSSCRAAPPAGGRSSRRRRTASCPRCSSGARPCRSFWGSQPRACRTRRAWRARAPQARRARDARARPRRPLAVRSQGATTLAVARARRRRRRRLVEVRAPLRWRSSGRTPPTSPTPPRA